MLKVDPPLKVFVQMKSLHQDEIAKILQPLHTLLYLVPILIVTSLIDGQELGQHNAYEIY